MIKIYSMVLAVLLLGGCGGGSGDSNQTRQDSDTGFGNNVPVATAQSWRLPEDGVLALVLEAEDLDRDTLKFFIATPPAHGTLSGTAPTLTYRPDPDYNGAEHFTFRVNDGQADSAEATVTLTVTPVNDAPDTQPDAADTEEDTPVMIAVLSNDSDRDRGDSLHIASVSVPTHGTATIEENKIRYTPAANWYGEEHFSYTASDGNGGETVAEVTVTVRSVNDLPVAKAGTDMEITLSEHVTLDGSGSSDVDGDTLLYRWVLDGAEVSTEPFYTFVGREIGSFVLTLEVDDQHGGSSSDGVTVTVKEPDNETPTAYRSTFTPMRPLVPVSSQAAIAKDLSEIVATSQGLIEEAERLMSEEAFVLDPAPPPEVQKDAVTRRRAKILEEVSKHEN